tara:strand:+ start:44 stop:295 length:252 start_codon:yes stop_codon:yes gene_type:complete
MTKQNKYQFEIWATQTLKLPYIIEAESLEGAKQDMIDLYKRDYCELEADILSDGKQKQFELDIYDENDEKLVSDGRINSDLQA